MADGVIVGSRIIQFMEADRSLAEVAGFTRKLRRAIDSL
jgi:tryptophan synthase alpha chain